MKLDARIFAEEQQIKLIDSILDNLCIVELNDNGRQYLKTKKRQINTVLIDLKSLKALKNKNKAHKLNGNKSRLSKSMKSLW